MGVNTEERTSEENSVLEAEFNQLLIEQRRSSESEKRYRNVIASIDAQTTRLLANYVQYPELKK